MTIPKFVELRSRTAFVGDHKFAMSAPESEFAPTPSAPACGCGRRGREGSGGCDSIGTKGTGAEGPCSCSCRSTGHGSDAPRARARHDASVGRYARSITERKRTFQSHAAKQREPRFEPLRSAPVLSSVPTGRPETLPLPGFLPSAGAPFTPIGDPVPVPGEGARAPVGGCISPWDVSPQFVEIFGRGDTVPRLRRRLGDSVTNNILLEELRDRGLEGNIERIRYKVDAGKRIYLFTDDLVRGVDRGFWTTGFSVVDCRDTIDWFPPAAPPGTAWSSIRIYDGGRCSLTPDFPARAGRALSWSAIAQLTANQVDNAVTAAGLGLARGVRLDPMVFNVTLRSVLDAEDRDGRGLNGDVFRIQFDLDIGRIPFSILNQTGFADLNCYPTRLGDVPRLRVNLTIGVRRTPGRFRSDCRETLLEGHDVDVPAPGTFDFRVDVRVRCALIAICNVRLGHGALLVPAEALESLVEDEISTRLPSQVERALFAGLQMDPAAAEGRADLFGVPSVNCLCEASTDPSAPCRCHQPCRPVFAAAGFEPPGHQGRHRCDRRTGMPDQCQIVFEPKALNFRPEGLEIVLAEDRRDPQMELLERLRNRDASPRGAPFVPATNGPACRVGRLGFDNPPPGSGGAMTPVGYPRRLEITRLDGGATDPTTGLPFMTTAVF